MYEICTAQLDYVASPGTPGTWQALSMVKDGVSVTTLPKDVNTLVVENPTGAMVAIGVGPDASHVKQVAVATPNFVGQLSVMLNTGQTLWANQLDANGTGGTLSVVFLKGKK